MRQLITQEVSVNRQVHHLRSLVSGHHSHMHHIQCDVVKGQQADKQ